MRGDTDGARVGQGCGVCQSKIAIPEAVPRLHQLNRLQAMAPKKKAGSKSKAAAAAAGGPVPEADGLLTFLQQTLQQLELVSGEADEESRAQLEALKDAFTVPPPGAAGVRQQPGAEVEASEADVEALLNKWVDGLCGFRGSGCGWGGGVCMSWST